jgi:hypothetical protein
MAFPLSFVDGRGVILRYRWEEYPYRVARVAKPIEFSWGCVDDIPPLTSDCNVVVDIAWCGPPAPLPSPFTADEFATGVMAWLLFRS